MLCYNRGLKKKPDYLKEGLMEYLSKKPRSLDDCVLQGAEILKKEGYKGPFGTDDFRIRVFEKLQQLQSLGFINKDRTVTPHLYKAAGTS